MILRYCGLLFFGFISLLSIAQKNSMALADSLFNLSQFEQAIVEYTGVLEKDPENEMALRGRGFSYAMLKQFDKGISDYQKAVKVNPSCIKCQVNLIRMLYSSDKKELAKSKIDSCLVVYATTAKNTLSYMQIMFLSAKLYSNEGKKVEAREQFDKIIISYPDSSLAYYVRAEFHYNNSSKSDALKDVEKAIELKNNVASYHKLRGRVYFDIKYYAETLKSFTTAIKLDSTDADAYWMRGSTYLEHFNKPKEASQDLKRAISLDTLQWQYYTVLGNSYYALEDMDSACWCSKKVVTKIGLDSLNEEGKYYKSLAQEAQQTYCNNDKVSYYFQRGIAMYNLGLYDSAVKYYNLGLKKFHKHPILLNFRANAFIVLQKWDEAIFDYYASLRDKEFLNKAVKQQFKGNKAINTDIYTKGMISSTYLGLSEAFIYKNKLQEALDMADSAINTVPLAKDIPLYTYYNQKGRVFMAKGLYDDAFTSFEKAKMVAPKNPLGYMNMALALANKSLGKRELYGGFSVSTNHNSLLGFNYKSKPIKLTDSKKHLLKEALTYCDMAVKVANTQAKPYLIRGYIKHLLGNTSMCEDVRKAMYLGNPDAAAYYQSICR